MGFTKSDYLTLHGENGITFSLFTELDDTNKIRNFLTNVKWNVEPYLPEAIEIGKDDFQVHLFPSFGRRYGAGEPDAIIIYGEFIFFIEVETKPIAKLSKHFFKQLNNFYSTGKFISETNQKKVVGVPVSITEDQRVYGQYRTRKIFKELFKKSNPQVYYIVITNDHVGDKKKSSLSLTSLNNRLYDNSFPAEFCDKLGWIGFSSINKLKANNKTKKVIQFNLEK